MTNDYPASLPYPNPSLGQMATLEEGGGSGRPSTAISGIQKHSVTGPQQVVLVLSCEPIVLG